MKNSDQPAFSKPAFYHPDVGTDPPQEGLTKREYFALHLMQSLVSNADRHSQEGDCQSWNYEHLSEIAIKATDELLKQLENESKTPKENP